MLACHSFCMQIKHAWDSWAEELSPLISKAAETLISCHRDPHRGVWLDMNRST